MLVSSLGLCMDDNVIRVAVGLRLGAPLCEPHHCQHCGDVVDHTGTHGLRCRYSKGRHPRHATITRSSSDPLALQTSPATWNPQTSTDLMENGLMACLSFRGREGKCWCGMPLVQTLWHHHTSLWHQERQVQWLRRPRKRSVLSMLIWRKATILWLWLWKLWECLAPMHALSSGNSGTALPMPHRILSPIFTSGRGYLYIAVQRADTAAILGPTVGSEYIGDFPSH